MKTQAQERLLEAIRRGYTISKHGIVRNRMGTVIRGSKTTAGYLKFSIRLKNVTSYPISFHRFQAYQKFGDKLFEKGIMVRHLNSIKTDNSWENIAIGTNSDNQLDIPKAVRRNRVHNPKHDHKAILEDRKQGLTYKEIMEKHNISSLGTLSYIVNSSMAQENGKQTDKLSDLPAK